MFLVKCKIRERRNIFEIGQNTFAIALVQHNFDICNYSNSQYFETMTYKKMRLSRNNLG